MNRAPTCIYYQKGECSRGEACEFNHPTVRCHTYSAVGFCPYGYACHFWHDPKLAVAQVSEQPSKKVCPFFINRQCRYGDKCSLSHDLDNHLASEASRSMTLTEYRQEQGGKKRTALNPRGNSQNRKPRSVSRPRQLKPKIPVSVSAVSMSMLNREEITNLNNLEVDNLLKSFPPKQLYKLADTEQNRAFNVSFSPSDQDWPYDIKEVLLIINIDRMYPFEPLQISVLETDVITKGFLTYLNNEVSSWIENHHTTLMNSNRIELYLKKFLTWFDQNLESLFASGLQKLKESYQKDDDKERRSVEPPRQTNDASDAEETAESGFEEHTGYLADEGTAAVDFSRLPPMQAPSMFSISRQQLRLDGIRFAGKAGTGLVQQLRAEMRCTTCHESFDWRFRMPRESASTPLGKQLVSMGPYEAECSSCRSAVGLVLKATHMNMFTNLCGSVLVSGCYLHSVRERHLSLTLQCYNCNAFTQLKEAAAGRENQQSCSHCQQPVSIAFDELTVGQPVISTKSTDVIPTCTKVATYRAGPGKTRPLDSFVIREGRELPYQGTCCHQKSSFRWLRFPCCEKAYPCDICHQESALDGHAMRYATKMVCGFCSKEQPFSTSKPCLSCQAPLCRPSASTWESDRGARSPTEFTSLQFERES